MKIVVTGGASGVGESLVRRLLEHEVWVLDRKHPENVADGHRFAELDLSNPQSIDEVISELPDSIDAIANVAGIAKAPDPITVLAVNFLGLRHLNQQLIPRLVDGGSIVNVSSVAGRDWQAKRDHLAPLLSTPSFEEGLGWCKRHIDLFARDPYTLSKRLVTAYTFNAAQDGIARHFRINCISPGPIETPLFPEFVDLMGEAQVEWTKAQTGGKAATPNDIAEVLDLLITGDCGWLNGVDIPVDGGYTGGMAAGWVDFAKSPVMAMLAKRKRS